MVTCYAACMGYFGDELRQIIESHEDEGWTEASFARSVPWPKKAPRRRTARPEKREDYSHLWRLLRDQRGVSPEMVSAILASPLLTEEERARLQDADDRDRTPDRVWAEYVRMRENEQRGGPSEVAKAADRVTITNNMKPEEVNELVALLRIFARVPWADMSASAIPSANQVMKLYERVKRGTASESTSPRAAEG